VKIAINQLIPTTKICLNAKSAKNYSARYALGEITMQIMKIISVCCVNKRGKNE